MGRASNRKWATRISAWRGGTLGERLKWFRLFGRYRKFKVTR